GDYDAMVRFSDLVALGQMAGHVGKLEAERLLHHGLVGRALAFRVRRRQLLAVLEPAERDSLGLFLALANDDHRRLLADRRVGEDARQVAHFLDVLAVGVYAHVAPVDARGPGRAPLGAAGAHWTGGGRRAGCRAAD